MADARPAELLTGYARVDTIPEITPVPGVHIRPISGAQLTLSFVTIDAGAVAPVHTHPQEQMGTLLEGEMEFEIDGDKRLMRMGEVYSVPPLVPHGARSVGGKPCVSLDVFTPRREDFLALARGLQTSGTR